MGIINAGPLANYKEWLDSLGVVFSADTDPIKSQGIQMHSFMDCKAGSKSLEAWLAVGPHLPWEMKRQQ